MTDKLHDELARALHGAMGNPPLIVENAGHGETPECDSRFAIGDVVVRRKRKWLNGLSERCVVVAVIPPGFPPEYALADAKKEPRPLMISRGSRAIRYVIGFENNRTPYLLKESDIKERVDREANITWEKPHD